MKSSLNYLKEVSVTFSMTMNDILFYVIDNFKFQISYFISFET